MTAAMAEREPAGQARADVARADAVVIGAGVAGLYSLWKMRQIGLTAIGLEAGDDVGGTWYWNRYPGARFDSESYTYGYSFDDGLLAEWEWSEHFAAQPETLRYLQHVADRFDLRRLIRFGARVQQARWDESACEWLLSTDTGETFAGRWLITALGPLSAPLMPRIEGVDDFAGEAFHTALWPDQPVVFDDKRVGVIGSGATAVQLIPEIAATCGSLTVFQRTPNWCAPLNNSRISSAEQAVIGEQMSDILERCAGTYGGFIHDTIREKTTDATAEQRRAFWEELYGQRGFGIWFGNYRDVLVSPEANILLTSFIAEKIRERVHDPATAEMLIPTDHGFGQRRVPLESGYYEVYNQPNVRLVDIRRRPIQRITQARLLTAWAANAAGPGPRAAADGLGGPAADRVSGELHELDMLIFATGFDAITGAYDRIDIVGAGGVSLRDAWDPSPRTLLGVATPGFPNLFMVVGPQNVSTFCNMTRCIEQNVDWLAGLVAAAAEAGQTRVEATPSAAEEWVAHTRESVQRLLLSRTDSWFNGYNANLDDFEPRLIIYGGGLPMYRERCDEVAASGYPGFVLS